VGDPRLAEPIGDFYTRIASVVTDPVARPALRRAGQRAVVLHRRLILAISDHPIITSLTREVFDTTPTEERRRPPTVWARHAGR
jgi:hypothetical protein